MTPEQEEAGYAALAADYQAEDAERRRIARRRTPPESWREDWDSPEDRADWDEGQQITVVINADPAVSAQVAAEVRKALEAVDRGETVDLGDFTQYAGPSAVTVTYDAEAEAAYVYLVPQDEAHSARTQELSDSVNVDYDASGRVVGVELLGVSRPEIAP